MYKCSKCGKKITEFDVNFSKNLFGKFDSENKCECAQCVANVKALEKPKKTKRKSKTIFYLLPYIIIAGIVLVVLFMVKNASKMDIDNFFDLFGENEWLPNVLMFVGGLFGLFLIFLIPSGYIYSIMKVMEYLGVENDDSYETIDVYKTTYDSSSGSFTTTKGTDYAGGGLSWPFFAGLVYPVWGIFALIIKLIRCNLPDRRTKQYIKKNFSKKVIKAYEKAKIETESIVISKKECDLKQKKENNYNEKCDQIKNKYGYLHDKDIISKKIEKLPKPYVTLKSNKGNCYNWIDGNNDNYVLLDKRNNERIYNGVYFYYTDDKE